jgi:hypothetical protein
MKRHETDIVSLIFGVIFTSVVGWWVVGRFFNARVDIPNAGWLAATTLILIGLLGVIASVRRGYRERLESDRPDGPGGPPTDPRI